MATYTERCGGGFPETASIEFKDGHVELVMGNIEYGTGLLTAYKQVVSDQLGIHADQIEVIMGDTDRTPAGLTGGSRSLPVGGSALYDLLDRSSRKASKSPRICSRPPPPICNSAMRRSPSPAPIENSTCSTWRRRRSIRKSCRRA